MLLALFMLTSPWSTTHYSSSLIHEAWQVIHRVGRNWFVEGRSQNQLNGEMWDWWFFGYKKVVVSHEKIGRLIVLLRVRMRRKLRVWRII